MRKEGGEGESWKAPPQSQKGSCSSIRTEPKVSPATFFPPPQAGTCSGPTVLQYRVLTAQRDRWELCSPSHMGPWGPASPD